MKYNIAICLAFFIWSGYIFGEVPRTISYQGVLSDENGNVIIDDVYKLVFELHTDPIEGIVVWRETHENVAVINGIFNVILGSTFPLDIAFEQRLYLAISVNDGQAFQPYTPLTSVPYSLGLADSTVSSSKIAAGQLVRSINGLTDAITIAGAGGAMIIQDGNKITINAGSGQGASGWSLAGNAGTDSTNFLGTTDSAPFEIRVGSKHALRIEPTEHGAVNIIAGYETNCVAQNVRGATISGGGDEAVPPNEITANFGTIGGGTINEVSGVGAVIAGGFENVASGRASTIAGGESNKTGEFGSIGGGARNQAEGEYTAIAGGENNLANNRSSVGGGANNRAEGDKATIGGGENNVAQSRGTVAGGFKNLAGRDEIGAATIGGGENNSATGDWSTVSGGSSNRATGSAATIPGGSDNQASHFSFAAGQKARALHQGSFVWNDGTENGSGSDSLVTTKPNQFLIRAAGGVGIGTNSPGSQLTVAGIVESNTGGFKFPDGTMQVTAASDGNAWLLSGNSETNPSVDFVGTVDSQPLEFRVNNTRILRIEPATSQLYGFSPNVIAGASGNNVAAGVSGASISGGGANNISVGDFSNSVTGDFGTIGGGLSNHADGEGSTISGGASNFAGKEGATVSGGTNNQATEIRATISGGVSNRAIGIQSTIGGGNTNTASGSRATVGGGMLNRANGLAATVPGGMFSRAGGDFSFAAGYYARAAHNGSFVWSDNSQETADSLVSTGENQFLIRANGGVGIGTNAPNAQLTVVNSEVGGTALYVSSGDGNTADIILGGNDGSGTGDNGRIHSDPAYPGSDIFLISNDAIDITLDSDGNESGDFVIRDQNGAAVFNVNENGNATLAGTLTENSDRYAKKHIKAVDVQHILNLLDNITVSTWVYRDDPDVMHIGPMAQDFKAAFKVGANETSISTIDRDGIAMAAIQALNQQLKEKEDKIAALESRLARIETLINQ